MTTRSENRFPPNPLFYLIGLMVILAGIGLVVVGGVGIATTVQRYESPLRGSGPAALAAAAATMFWGVFVLTAGRVVWRGARRRGAKDRVGRLFMVLALGFVGLGVHGLLLGLAELAHATTEDEARTRLFVAYLPYLASWIPAMILAFIGSRMAKETEPLLSVSARADL